MIFFLNFFSMFSNFMMNLIGLVNLGERKGGKRKTQVGRSFGEN